MIGRQLGGWDGAGTGICELLGLLDVFPAPCPRCTGIGSAAQFSSKTFVIQFGRVGGNDNRVSTPLQATTGGSDCDGDISGVQAL